MTPAISWRSGRVSGTLQFEKKWSAKRTFKLNDLSLDPFTNVVKYLDLRVYTKIYWNSISVTLPSFQKNEVKAVFLTERFPISTFYFQAVDYLKKRNYLVVVGRIKSRRY